MSDLSQYRVIRPAFERHGLIQSVYEQLASNPDEDAPRLSLDRMTPSDALYALRYSYDCQWSMLNEFGVVFAPSRWQQERMASQYGVRVPIRYAPCPINAEAFTATKRIRGQKLRVLFLAAHADQPRKGVDLAKAAFSAAFGSREDVELIIRSTYPAPMLTKNAANINISGSQLQGESYAEYLGTFDCLIQPARAEVYGLTAVEAILTGMPVIHSGATGLEDIAGMSLHVRHRGVRCADGTEWREPFADEMADRLRELDVDYKNTMRHAMIDAKTLRKRLDARDKPTQLDGEESNDGAATESADVSIPS
jgi:glycosyltransferase involved in cell wall biosynthesis